MRTATYSKLKTLCCITFFSVFFLSACFNNAEVVYDRYTLIEDLRGEAIGSDYEIKVNLLDILNEGGIVLKTSSVTLRPASNHRWAIDLNAQLQALLAESFYNHKVSTKNNYKIYIYKFYGDAEGNVEIAALFVAERGQRKIMDKTFSYSGVQQQPGYEHLVMELKKGFRQLADQIAESLQ